MSDIEGDPAFYRFAAVVIFLQVIPVAGSNNNRNSEHDEGKVTARNRTFLVQATGRWGSGLES